LFKKTISSFAAIAIALAGVAGLASPAFSDAAPVTFTAQPSFMFDAQTGQITNFNQGLWTLDTGHSEDAAARIATLFACNQEQSSITTPTTSPVIGDCVILMTEAAASTPSDFYTSPPASLASAHTFGTPTNFDQSGIHSTYTHLIAVTRLLITPTGETAEFYWVRTASVPTATQGFSPPPAAPSFSVGIELKVVNEKLEFASLGSWSSGTPSNFLFVCDQPTTGSGTTESRQQGVPPTSFFGVAGKNCLGVGENSPGAPISDLTSASKLDVKTWRVNDSGAQRSYAELLERAGGEAFVHFALQTETYANGLAYAFWSDSVSFLGQQSSATGDVARMVPFTGPTLNTPAIPSGVRAGSALTIPGSNLSGVTKVEIGGLDAQVKVNASGELEIVVPAGLAAGTYDIVLTSSEGRVTVQSAITIRAGAGLGAAGESRPSTKRIDSSSAKVYFYGAVGAGKVQILLNGKEVGWVNASDASDAKLRDGRFVRTLTLAAGKNVIQVLVDGKQVRRTVYTN
jgi:hypothetical protein